MDLRRTLSQALADMGKVDAPAGGIAGYTLTPSARNFSRLATSAAILATDALLLTKMLYAAYLHEVYYRSDLRPLYAFVRRWL